MTMVGWVLFLSQLTLQLVEARSDCGPLEFFVPRVWKGVGVTDVVKVTYSNGLFGGNLTEASAIMGEFLQCCGWASPKSAILSVEDFEDGTRRTHSLSCSILPSHSTLDGNDSGDTPSLLDFCLRFNSSVSSSFVVANSERSDVKDLGCELKADAVISLFLYLKWYWLSPSRPSFLASVQSRGECLSVSCNLSISTRSWLSESVALRGGFFSGCLGTVKWFGALSSKGPALLSQEYEAALTPHKESNRSFEHFGMRPPEEKSITKMFDLSLSALSPMSTIQPLGSGLNQLGRRSLQVNHFLPWFIAHTHWAELSRKCFTCHWSYHAFIIGWLCCGYEGGSLLVELFLTSRGYVRLGLSEEAIHVFNGVYT